MARTEVRSHRKFKQLVRFLDGDIALAMGLLECMWQSAYQTGTDYLGDAGDVELACEWGDRDPGALAAQLEQSGWIDKNEHGYFVHDLWDHAPEYVKLRLRRKGYGPRITQNKELHSKTTDKRTTLSVKRGEVTTNVVSTQPNPTQPNQEEEGAAAPPESAKVVKAAFDPIDYPWPDALACDESFDIAWRDFVAHRKGMRKPLTERACKLLVSDFMSWGPAGAASAMRDSIKGGYQGVFAPKGVIVNRPAPAPKEHSW